MGYTAIAADYPILEAGTYKARFIRVEPSTEPSQYGDYLDWHFEALGPDGPTEVMGRSSRLERYTSSSKARQWYEALLGRPLAAGEVMDWDQLHDTLCTLTIEVKAGERGDSNRITNIVKRAKAPAIDPAPKPEFDEGPADKSS